MKDQNYQDDSFFEINLPFDTELPIIFTPKKNGEEASNHPLDISSNYLNNCRTGIGEINNTIFLFHQYNSTNDRSSPILDNLNEANEIKNEIGTVEGVNRLGDSWMVFNQKLDDIDSVGQIQPANEVVKKINITQNKRGRPPKTNPYKGEHTRKASDNASKVVITKCKNNIHNFLMKQIKFFIYFNKNTVEFINSKIILHMPTINQYLIKGGSQKYTLFYTSMKSLYCSSIPKRVEDKIRNERDKYSYNKDTLTKILEAEKNDETILDKKLNRLFEANFIIYLEAFLNDKNSITINGINYDLDIEFDTFKDCFNYGESAYTKEEKDEIKAYIYSIINKEMHFRNRKKKK